MFLLVSPVLEEENGGHSDTREGLATNIHSISSAFNSMRGSYRSSKTHGLEANLSATSNSMYSYNPPFHIEAFTVSRAW